MKFTERAIKGASRDPHAPSLKIAKNNVQTRLGEWSERGLQIRFILPSLTRCRSLAAPFTQTREILSRVPKNEENSFPRLRHEIAQWTRPGSRRRDASNSIRRGVFVRFGGRKSAAPVSKNQREFRAQNRKNSANEPPSGRLSNVAPAAPETDINGDLAGSRKLNRREEKRSTWRPIGDEFCAKRLLTEAMISAIRRHGPRLSDGSLWAKTEGLAEPHIEQNNQQMRRSANAIHALDRSQSAASLTELRGRSQSGGDVL